MEAKTIIIQLVKGHTCLLKVIEISPPIFLSGPIPPLPHILVHSYAADWTFVQFDWLFVNVLNKWK
jgi:hypothetical protein